MSEQKHMDTVEQARKLLSDGDENYKLHTVIWLYQQSEQVAALTKENEELKSILAGAMGGRTPADDEVERLREERKEYIQLLKCVVSEANENDSEYFAITIGTLLKAESLLSKFEV